MNKVKSYFDVTLTMLLINFIDIIFGISLLLFNILYFNYFYINSNTVQVTLLIYIYDTIFLLLYFFYKTNIISIIGEGFIYVFYVNCLVLFIFFLVSIYWQESVRLYCLNCWLFSYKKTPISSLKLLNQKIIKHEYFFIISLINAFFINLLFNLNSISLYISFEIISLLVLILLSFQVTKETIKATVIYFFYSFYSTIFLLWGLLLMYTNLNFDLLIIKVWIDLSDNTTITWYLSFIFILISFLIKLGLFPYHIWVVEVYSRLSNLNHIFFITIISFSYLLSFLSLFYTYNSYLSHTFLWSVINLLLNISAIGSTVCGAFLLYYQTTFKGFFAATSIITNGFILLAFSGFFELTLLSNKFTLLWIIFLYLLFYYSSIYILYNIWNSFIIWKYMYLTLRIEDSVFIKKTIVLSLIIKQFFLRINNFTYLSYLNNYIRTIKIQYKFNIIKQRLVSYNKNYTLKYNIYNLNFINVSWLPLTTFYQDYSYYLLFWVLLGFPPFLLFILKFYVYLFILKANLVFSALIISLLTNLVVTGALCRILTLLTIRLNYKYNYDIFFTIHFN